MNIAEQAHKMKLASPKLAASSLEQRNQALDIIAEALQAHKEEIFAANVQDMGRADETGVSAAVKKRLKFDEGKLEDVVKGLYQLKTLPDPLNRTRISRELDEGLRLYQVTCPIGVIGVIFEARPDALVQISSLCIKSGNCAILKGGKETAETNRVLFKVIYESVLAAGLPEGCMLQAESHSEIDELLACDKDVDLLIPRGSNQFVRYIMDHTKIPVMGHADGICHIYIDKMYDKAKAIPIVIDAKTQYTAACNAVETLLIHWDIAADLLPDLAAALTEAGVKLRGTREAAEIIAKGSLADSPDGEKKKADKKKESIDGEKSKPEGKTESRDQISMELMEEDDFNTEYLDLILSVKLVDGVEEAVSHINRFGSHHTDCIITEDSETADYFMQMVDSAGVYQNCSTRFADGFRYGFGAEVGISTGKIHARGPVGLDGLITYKYKLFGEGQIVGDYASGKREFHFRDLN
ncbi:MAG: glutamate-5-semialdehyde dehydrogenase [Eubacterium sp.]|nr:glutamate-5-semialdehyde dehydrogenase [Eubacterium sp.]